MNSIPAISAFARIAQAAYSSIVRNEVFHYHTPPFASGRGSVIMKDLTLVVMWG